MLLLLWVGGHNNGRDSLPVYAATADLLAAAALSGLLMKLLLILLS